MVILRYIARQGLSRRKSIIYIHHIKHVITSYSIHYTKLYDEDKTAVEQIRLIQQLDEDLSADQVEAVAGAVEADFARLIRLT